MLQERSIKTDLSYKFDKKNKFFQNQNNKEENNKINYNKNYKLDWLFGIFKTLDANSSIENIIIFSK